MDTNQPQEGGAVPAPTYQKHYALEPEPFVESNVVFKGRPYTQEENPEGKRPAMADLEVYREGTHTISCWKAGFWARVFFLLTGRFYLHQFSGGNFFPTIVYIGNPFSKEFTKEMKEAKDEEARKKREAEALEQEQRNQPEELRR